MAKSASETDAERIRAERLAKALRDNLRRRKAASRKAAPVDKDRTGA